MTTLPSNHDLKKPVEKKFALSISQHCFLLKNITLKQQEAIKHSIVNSNNCFNEIFYLFDSLNKEFYPEYQLVNSFSDQFSFHKADHSSIDSKKHHCKCLNEIIFNISSNPNSIIIVSNASIKNNIATSISHIHFFNSLLKKTIHHTIHVMSIEAELFAIRCGIN